MVVLVKESLKVTGLPVPGKLLNLSKLASMKLRVPSTTRKQFVVRASFGYESILQDYDAVSPAHER